MPFSCKMIIRSHTCWLWWW